jgi:hypothetical protein
VFGALSLLFCRFVSKEFFRYAFDPDNRINNTSCGGRWPAEEVKMKPGLFLAISIVLLAVWVGSIAMLHISSLMVHLLLLLAVLFLAGHLVEGTTTT